MAEAVLAGEQVKELTPQHGRGLLTAFDAELARFAKHFLMGPGDRSNRNRQPKQTDDLLTKIRLFLLDAILSRPKLVGRESLTPAWPACDLKDEQSRRQVRA